MESIAVATGLWKKAQDQCWSCGNCCESMGKRFEVVASAQAAFTRTRRGADQLQAGRDEAKLRLAIAEMLLGLRETEQKINDVAATLSEAVGQSKMFGVLDICPDGA